MESQKGLVPPGGSTSISQIESELPPLSGENASISTYFTHLRRNEERLNSFYNGNNHIFKSHNFDQRRARMEEFKTIANSILKLIGGSVGAKRRADRMVVIGIGLGEFGSNNRLSSLHESFLAYFINLLRSLGYIVVGINEYYTSKKCPVCHQFVSQVNIRRLFCRGCGVPMHRDIMAADNMCNVVKEYLIHQRRPRYLQPVCAKGHHPWEKECDCEEKDSTTFPTTSVVTTATAQGTSSSTAIATAAFSTTAVATTTTAQDITSSTAMATAISNVIATVTALDGTAGNDNSKKRQVEKEQGGEEEGARPRKEARILL
ncbi:putative transposase [Entomortierella parvispora]|uniref:Transposase n=1 Tax=Entomortierella parvispora TaxID=205924 RepID=A0A9P3HF52_9FUNG|nr:putative transposase [Entomortierella parvispora]